LPNALNCFNHGDTRQNKNFPNKKFVVPKNEDFSQWVYALKAASAIDHQLSYNPTGKRIH
jgi:hypothetical protein